MAVRTRRVYLQFRVTHAASANSIVANVDGEEIVYNPGDISWILACTALVWIMIPGLGFFYSGLLRRKNALTQIYLGVMVLAVVSFQVRSPPSFLLTLLTTSQWFFWGYSLAFSDTGSPYIGNLSASIRYYPSNETVLISPQNTLA